jgi:hypothetical protein
MQFPIHQINTHKSCSVFTSLNAALPSQGPYLYLLQEPYLYLGNVCGLDKSRLYFTQDVSSHTSIFSNLPLTFHAHLSGSDCTTCSMELGGRKVFFSSVYLDINQVVAEPNWAKTITKAESTGSSHYARVDGNSHSTLWGCNITNPRGSNLETFIYSHNIILHNTGSKPTFETQRGSSIIDITLTSPSLANQVTRWQVHDKMHLSDHHLVSSLVSLRPEPLPVRNGCKLKKVNWTLFRSHVETALADFEILLLRTPARIESCAEALQEAITIGLDK